MTGKAISRKLCIDRLHQAVSLDFGNDAGGSDGKRYAVTLDHSIMGKGEVLYRQTINETAVWCGF